MKNLFILLGVIGFVLILGKSADAQTKIYFEKGASSKTLTISVPANDEKDFLVRVRKDQVINVTVSGDINMSKTVDFPVIAVNLINGEEPDNWLDGEGFLSVLAGTGGDYIFRVSNSSSRTRTFRMSVSVTDDLDDYVGGISID